MQRLLFVFLLISIFFSCEMEKRATPNLLVFSKTEGYRHASIPAATDAIMALGEGMGYRVTATEDAAHFTEENLAGYAAVVFLNTSGDVLNNVQQADFQRFVEAGGGFVGIHGAAATEYDWHWYGRLVGAYFDSHPAVQEARVSVSPQGGDLVAQLPGTFSVREEWYDFRPVPPVGKVWVDAPNTVLAANNIGTSDSLRQLEKHIDPRVAWRYGPDAAYLPEGANVLLEVDGASYEGSKHGGSHPVSWYREYEGGRSFYTALGHMDETYADPVFLQHLSNGLAYAIGEDALDFSKAKTHRIPPSDRFVRTTLAANLNEPTELEILPDGRVIFLERRGAMKCYDPRADTLVTILQMPVYDANEEGFMGVGLDPHWQQNRFIYLYYSLMEGGRRNRLSRFVFDGEMVHMATEAVLLEVPEIDGCCHTGGSIAFDSKGNLYLSTGDNTNPFESDGYSPSDERPGRQLWDAQRSSGNTNDLRGKILRIKPEPDGTYSIPDGNMFPIGTPGTRPEIYVMGCRNPYRIAIDSQTDCLFWGDVGPDAGKDGPVRGPKGYDTFNRTCGPANAGWPFVRGNHVYQRYDFAAKKPGAHHDPDRIINRSPNNTGLRELPPVQPPLIWYSYDESTEFPWTATGGKNPMAGPVFHAAAFAEGATVFPPYFEDKFFAYEWMRDWIFVVTLDENGHYVQADPFLPNERFNNPMDMAFGPDGALYLLEYGESWFSQNPDARLTKIEYAPGNRRPIAKIATTKTIGAAPMEVKFSASGSMDHDGDKMQFEWKIGRKTLARTSDFTHVFTLPGRYEVVLKATDPHGLHSHDKALLFVGNEPPEVAWQLVGNQTFYSENAPVQYAVQVRDKEDGNNQTTVLDPRRLRISIDYLKEGKDVAQVVLGHQTAGMSAGRLKYAAGLSVMEKSDCATCHAEDRKVNGPSYIDIANRYFGDGTALQTLAAKIIKGGGGAWGETTMAAHPQITEQEAESIVQYILSLAGETQASASLPATGTYSPTAHIGREEEGAYIFQATYSDAGAAGMASLSATATKVLRPPKVEAEHFSQASKGIRTKKESRTGEVFLTGLSHGRYFSFEKMDLTGITRLELGFYKNGETLVGTTIEARAGNPSGELLGSSQITAGDSSIVTLVLKPGQGLCNLFFVFKNEKEKDRETGLLDWVRFLF